MDQRHHRMHACGFAALLALAGCGGGEQAAPGPRSAAAAAAPRADAATPEAFAATTYDPATPDRVTVGTIVFEGTRYNNVVASFGALLGIGNGVATRTYDQYDAASGRLTVASVTVGGTTYTDVVVAVTGVLSVGSAAPVAPVEPNDPMFGDQWHLHNTGQAGFDGVAGSAGEDLNVRMAWNYATGTGVRIAVVDDGLDIQHEDLPVVAGKSWDYRSNEYGDPSAATSSHGTSVGGLAAARGNNGIGVAGVAFNAQLVGYNLLAASVDQYGADAVVKDLASNHVYNNSYGAADSNGLFATSTQVWRDAIDTGTRTGRGGKGVVYTWAAGNGAPEDRSDYDGQANYQGVLAIGSLNDRGQRSSYSEPGANVLVAAFGGEFCSTHTTTTTDVSGAGGYNNGASAAKPEDTYTDIAGAPHYTRCMNGTSAATPEAAGVVALLLEANPALGWRDVRAILATTARKNDPAHAGWVANGAGLRVNHEYGYGAIDAAAAVAAARAWQNLPAQKTATAQSASALPIPDAGAAVTSTLALADSGIGKLEFVDLVVASDHPEVGDLEITLTSPAGTTSTVSVARDCKAEGGAAQPCGNPLAEGLRFGIVRLMNEAADGNWTLTLRDHKTGNVGALLRWSIVAYGY